MSRFPVTESLKAPSYCWFAKTGKFALIIWGNKKVNVTEKNDDVAQLCDISCGLTRRKMGGGDVRIAQLSY